jgi:hypothetical protein
LPLAEVALADQRVDDGRASKLNPALESSDLDPVAVTPHGTPGQMAEELARARLDLEEALLGRRVQATETAVILGLLQYHIRRSLQGCFGPALGLLGFARA